LPFIKIRFVNGEKYGGNLPTWLNVANEGGVVWKKDAGRKNALEKFDLKIFIAMERGKVY
jgi:hypothetical protein